MAGNDIDIPPLSFLPYPLCESTDYRCYIQSRFGFIGRNYATCPNQGMVSIEVIRAEGKALYKLSIISRYRGIEGSMHDDMEAGSIVSAFLTSS